MARERMVTRTITSTLVTVMQVNTETAEVTNKNYNISSIFNDDAKLLRAVKKLYETEEEKIVAIVDKQEISDLYGMTENEFLTHAHIIPRKETKGEN